MIVEIYGLPGSGKTTLARRLVTDRNFLRVNFDSKIKIFTIFIRTFFHFPLHCILSLKFAVTSNSPFKKIWSTYLVKTSKYLKAVDCAGFHENIILDEGPHQNILSYAGVNWDIVSMQAFLKNIPMPDLVIVFDVEAKKRKENIHRRELSRNLLEIKRSHEEIDSMEKANRLFIEIIKNKDEHYKVVYSVDEAYRYISKFS